MSYYALLITYNNFSEITTYFFFFIFTLCAYVCIYMRPRAIITRRNFERTKQYLENKN